MNIGRFVARDVTMVPTQTPKQPKNMCHVRPYQSAIQMKRAPDICPTYPEVSTHQCLHGHFATPNLKNGENNASACVAALGEAEVVCVAWQSIDGAHQGAVKAYSMLDRGTILARNPETSETSVPFMVEQRNTTEASKYNLT